MPRHALTRSLALALCAASLVMMAYSIASLVLPGTELIPERPSVVDFLTFALALVAFPTIGLLVVWNRPEHPLGWIFLAIALGVTASVFAGEYADRSVYTGAAFPGYELAAWVGGWSFIISIGLALTFATLLFPTGRLPGPHWRPFAWLAAGVLVVSVIAEAIRPGRLPDYADVAIANPFGADPALAGPISAAADIGFAAALVLGLVSITSLIVRFRRSTGTERQQLKWFLYPTALFLIGLAAASTFQTELAWSIAILGLSLIPVGAGIAILRHRLFDIDLVINRTLVYGSLTVLLGAVYIGLVLGLQALVSPLLGTDTVAVALSTLAVAALFGPARRRVQAAVDRRFYRSRYDAQRTLEAFAGRLRDQVDPEPLVDELRDATVSALRPSSASVWLRGR